MLFGDLLLKIIRRIQWKWMRMKSNEIDWIRLAEEIIASRFVKHKSQNPVMEKDTP